MKFHLELSDGSTHVVTRTIREQVACETYFRANKRLGQMSENPFRSLAFVAWAAAKREQVIGDIPFDQFLEGTDPDTVHLVNVDGIDEDEEVEGLGEDTSADPHGS